jgi:hypothetical protein
MLLDASTYQILEVSKAFLESYRVSQTDVLGKSCFEATHHLDRPCHLIDHTEKCPLKESLETGALTHVEHLHRDRAAESSILKLRPIISIGWKAK